MVKVVGPMDRKHEIREGKSIKSVKPNNKATGTD